MLRGLTVSQLRWMLLILGGLFIGALALWERFRPRQARGREPGTTRATQEPALGGLPAEALKRGAGPAEPWINDEPLGTPLPGEESWREAAATGPLAELPSVHIDAPDEPEEPDEPLIATAPVPEEDLEVTDEWETLEEGVGEVRIVGEPTASPVPAASAVPAAEVPSGAPLGESELRVEWPPESERHIVALRLVAGPERFPGRTLRLALAAEGFRLGRFDIFHQPDHSGRAILSAASLTRPGTFDLDSMDSQRFAGLNLFMVLPGPLPAAAAFEALLGAADNLNERLQGEVQDERGEPLTVARIAQLRESLAEDSGEALS